MGRSSFWGSIPTVLVIAVLILIGPGAMFGGLGYVYGKGEIGGYDSVDEPHVEVQTKDQSRPSFGHRLWDAIWGNRGEFSSRPRVATSDYSDGYNPSGRRYTYVRDNPQNAVFTAWPTVGPVVTSKYGYRIHPTLHTRKFHDAVDIDCDPGEPVYATADGVVTVSKRHTNKNGATGACGEMVDIYHGYGMGAEWDTHYCHFSSRLVEVGDHVQAGQVIGMCGSTGRSTGPHVHIRVNKDGKDIDPLTVLPR